MTLHLSKFRKDSPAETTEEIVEMEFTHDLTNHCFSAEFDGIQIPGEPPMSIGVTCTDPHGYLSIVVFRNGSNIINLTAALKNYAHAMIEFPSGYYLDIHVERERLQKAPAA